MLRTYWKRLQSTLRVICGWIYAADGPPTPSEPGDSFISIYFGSNFHQKEAKSPQNHQNIIKKPLKITKKSLKIMKNYFFRLFSKLLLGCPYQLPVQFGDHLSPQNISTEPLAPPTMIFSVKNISKKITKKFKILKKKQIFFR